MGTKIDKRGGDQVIRQERYYAVGSPYSNYSSTPYYVSNLVVYGPNWPDWKNRIALGKQCTTSLYAEGILPGFIRGNIRYNRSGYPYPRPFYYENIGGWEYYSSPWVPQGTSFSLNYDQAFDECVIGFLQRVKGVQQKFSSGVFLGELGQTLRLMRSPAKALSSVLETYVGTATKRALRTRGSRSKRIKEASKAVSDTWLEASFGIVPLVSDINDIAAAIRHQGKTLGQWEPVRYSVKKSGPPSYYLLSPQYFSNLLAQSIRIMETEHLIVSLYGAVGTPQVLPAVTSSFGFTPSDFFPTIWNLLPWSFLVDYFANVGGMIDGLSTSQAGVRWKGRTFVQEFEAKPLNKLRSGAPLSYTDGDGVFTSISHSLSVSTARKRIVSRIPYDAPLAPNLVFRIPGTGTRWANIAALATSYFSSQKRISASFN